MASQGGPQFPADLGKPPGKSIAVLGEVQRGVAAGREEERDKNDTSGTPFHADRSAGGNVRFGDFQEGRFDQVLGTPSREFTGQPRQVLVGRVQSAAVGD